MPTAGRTLQAIRLQSNASDRNTDTRPSPPTGMPGSVYGGIRINVGGIVKSIPIIGPLIAQGVPPLVQFLPPQTPVVAMAIAQPAGVAGGPRVADLPASGGVVTGYDPFTGRASVQVGTIAGPKQIQVDLPFPDAGLPAGPGDISTPQVSGSTIGPTETGAPYDPSVGGTADASGMTGPF